MSEDQISVEDCNSMVGEIFLEADHSYTCKFEIHLRALKVYFILNIKANNMNL